MSTDPLTPSPPRSPSPWRALHPSLVIGALITLAILAIAALSLVGTPHDPAAMAIADKLQPPSAAHRFGTDHFGRDVASMMMVGARTSIAVAFARSPMTMAQIAWDLNQLSNGRFVLGLGSQIKPHITKRFSMPWSHPAARMRELILAMRAIWDC